MAFATANLVLLSHGNDKKLFYYNSTADTLATINTAGYFNNDDDAIRMVAGDLILTKGSDAEAMLVVSSVSSGSVTTYVSDHSAVVKSEAGSTTTALDNIGRTGLGATTGVRTYSLTAPFAGARKTIVNETTMAHVVSISTAVTFDGTGNTMTFIAAKASVTLEGQSATVWNITGVYPYSSYVALT